MKRLLLSLALVGATTAAASAQITGPLTPAPHPPVGVNQTLLFNAMLATAQAAARGNASAAQSARIYYESAIRQFDSGNVDAARISALRALSEAGVVAPVTGPIRAMNPYTAPSIGEPMSEAQAEAITRTGTVLPSGPAKPMQPYVAPNVPQTVIVPGTVASINADAFVAAARRSVNACVAAKSPAAAVAQQRLADAERANAGGQYGTVVANAQSIVDLCAAAQQMAP